jgi:UDP-glucose 4-epimerase
MKTVVITGGGGYIGGQTAIYFKEQGWNVTAIDRNPQFDHLEPYIDNYIHADFAEPTGLSFLHSADVVVHCAGSSLVGPSIKDPSAYYENNFIATKRMLDYMVGNKLFPKIIFSSSAAVYGNPLMTPIREEDPKDPISPYGISKHMVEQLLETYSVAYGINYVGLRYFNAAGADPQGRHGQAKDATHIIAKVMEAIKHNRVFTLNGTGLDTEDGTCVRDYVHVADIAKAHFYAQEQRVVPGFYNLSTGLGASNLDILHKCCKVSDSKPQAVVEGPMREGDPATLVANNTKFFEVSNWQNEYHVDDIIEHAWKWYTRGV